ncbi:hypothetical protein H311_01965 [Anncaliia algerae PRA109]|nr:hypothetical protein H311_01965 [Anncaliia algerae PRA109]
MHSEHDDHITRGFAVLIPNKKEDTIIPILCNNTVNGSTIWTDEHKSYSSLTKNGYFNQSVCHKYNFINKVNGCNTQAVEAFNNELKLEIKRRKGVLTNSRGDF